MAKPRKWQKKTVRNLYALAAKKRKAAYHNSGRRPDRGPSLEDWYDSVEPPGCASLVAPCPTEENEWDFDPENTDQVFEFLRRITKNLSETEERMLLCLVDSEEGLAALRNHLYK